MEIYKDNIVSYKNESEALSNADRRISLFRFVSALAAIILIYQYNISENYVLLLLAALCIGVFFVLIKKH